MRLDNRDIPEPVLNGRVKKFLKVYNRYRALLTQAICQIINESYWIRSEGEVDNLGNKWTPLAPMTIQIKTEDQGIGQFYEYTRDKAQGRGLFSPAQRKLYDVKYKQALGKSTSSAAKSIARKAAFAAVENSPNVNNSASPESINIRTGRMVAATAPGVVVGNRYYPPEDQIVVTTYAHIEITFDVEYKEAMENVVGKKGRLKSRKIIPDGALELWVAEAHESIIDEVKAYYVDMLASDTERRANSNKRRKKQ